MHKRSDTELYVVGLVESSVPGLERSGFVSLWLEGMNDLTLVP